MTEFMGPNSNRVATFKIFISNLPDGVTNENIRDLFAPYGRVVESEVFKTNYAFVHMEDDSRCFEAVTDLNGLEIEGNYLSVVQSKNGQGPKTKAIKLAVDNIHISIGPSDLRNLFRKYGLVLEAEVCNGQGHVLLEAAGDVSGALQEISGFVIHGQALAVEVVENYVSNSVNSSRPGKRKEPPPFRRGGGFQAKQPSRINSNKFAPYPPRGGERGNRGPRGQRGGGGDRGMGGRGIVMGQRGGQRGGGRGDPRGGQRGGRGDPRGGARGGPRRPSGQFFRPPPPQGPMTNYQQYDDTQYSADEEYHPPGAPGFRNQGGPPQSFMAPPRPLMQFNSGRPPFSRPPHGGGPPGMMRPMMRPRMPASSMGSQKSMLALHHENKRNQQALPPPPPPHQQQNPTSHLEHGGQGHGSESNIDFTADIEF